MCIFFSPVTKKCLLESFRKHNNVFVDWINGGDNPPLPPIKTTNTLPRHRTWAHTRRRATGADVTRLRPGRRFLSIGCEAYFYDGRLWFIPNGGFLLTYFVCVAARVGRCVRRVRVSWFSIIVFWQNCETWGKIGKCKMQKLRKSLVLLWDSHYPTHAVSGRAFRVCACMCVHVRARVSKKVSVVPCRRCMNGDHSADLEPWQGQTQ